MIVINKQKAKIYKRALQYLQAAVAHIDLKYLNTVSSVQDMATKEVLSVHDMSSTANPVGYSIGQLTGYGYSDVQVWVGFSMTTKPGDVYRYHAWAFRLSGELIPGWPEVLSEGIEDQQKFTFVLRNVLSPDASPAS